MKCKKTLIHVKEKESALTCLLPFISMSRLQCTLRLIVRQEVTERL